MANITENTLTSANEGSAATVFTTASIAPAANQLVLLIVMAQRIGGDPSIPTVAGNGLTWVQIGTQLIASTNDGRITLFRAMGAAPSSGTVVITYSEEQNNATWIISEFDNVSTTGLNGSGAIVQAVDEVSSVTTTPSITLAAFENSANATFGATSNLSQGAYTPGTGFAEIADLDSALACQTQWRDDNDTSVTWTGNSLAHGMIAVEIRSNTVVVAITQASLTGAADAVNRTVYTTASITPTGNSLVLLACIHNRGAGPQNPTVAGNGLTWVLVNSGVVTSTLRLNVYRAMGVAPTTGTVTLTFPSDRLRCAWAITEYANVLTTGSNGEDAIVQSVAGDDDSVTSPFSVTLAAFGETENATYGAFGFNANQTISAGSGFAELYELEVESLEELYVEWKATNDTGVDCSWSSGTPEVAGIAIEIAAVQEPSSGTSKAGTAGHMGIMLGW